MDKPNKHCAKCGTAFVCDYALGKQTCWCSQNFPAVMPMKNSELGCYCPVCLEKKISALMLEASAKRGAG